MYENLDFLNNCFLDNNAIAQTHAPKVQFAQQETFQSVDYPTLNISMYLGRQTWLLELRVHNLGCAWVVNNMFDNTVKVDESKRGKATLKSCTTWDTQQLNEYSIEPHLEPARPRTNNTRNLESCNCGNRHLNNSSFNKFINNLRVRENAAGKTSR